MPELPEVETVVRSLRAMLPGRSILSVRLGKTDFMDDPVALGDFLPGRRIESVERIGKFIRMRLAASASARNPDEQLNLIVHLGMTGKLIVHAANAPEAAHTHGFFELDDGRELRYTDIRRFGQILLVADSNLAPFRERLGEEPLEVSLTEFVRRLAGRRARIKALLLDQRVFRGIGNIYADESLWRSQIHPARLAARLTKDDLVRLRRAIQDVLKAAIRMHGSSISDFVDGEGTPGSYQQRHRVYSRMGKPCARCGSAIRRAIVAGRSSYFCPRCQTAPRMGRAVSGKGIAARPHRAAVRKGK
jgi:formamidopyrimidine-DNA glycosylase